MAPLPALTLQSVQRAELAFKVIEALGVSERKDAKKVEIELHFDQEEFDSGLRNVALRKNSLVMFSTIPSHVIKTWTSYLARTGISEG